MAKVLILGGTRGLGRAYAIKVLAQGYRPIIVGRSADEASKDPALAGAVFVQADIGNASDHERILDAAFMEEGMDVVPHQVVWCAGAYHRGPVIDMTPEQVEAMTRVHWTGPVAFLGAFHRRVIDACACEMILPYDLVVIGSVLAHVPGRQHAVLSGLKAAKVHFARVFSQELTRDLPGSAVLVINPWGMKTDFFAGTDTKTDGFMDPAYVADVIAEQLAIAPRDPSLERKGLWPVEITLDRDKGGGTKVLVGPQPPKC